MHATVRIGAPLALAFGALAAIAAAALVLHGPSGGLQAVYAVTAVVFLPTGLVGSALVRAAPRNRLGWLLLAASVALPVSVLCQVVADAAYVYGDDGVPAPAAIALVGAASGLFADPLLATFGVLWFPDGALPAADPRTRLLARACAVDLAVLGAWALFSPTLLGTSAADVASPIGVGPAGLLVLAILALAPLSFLTARTLHRRARAAPTPEARSALRLAAIAAFAIAASFGACVVVGVAGGSTQQVARGSSNCSRSRSPSPPWVGVARDRLFDLRTIVGRTLTSSFLFRPRSSSCSTSG